MLLVAIVAFDDAVSLVYYVEDGEHGLVVADAYRIVAFHDTPQFVRSFYGLLFYNFVVLDDVEHGIRSQY